MAPRGRLFGLIRDTPHLDWLLLTKRPQNVQALCTLSEFPNVWLGVSVENQQNTWRIVELLKIPAALRFLSCEPLLGPISFMDGPLDEKSTMGEWSLLENGIHWVIAGGESGHQARPCHVEWVRSLVKQCRDARVACFVKQLGAHPQPSPLPSDVCVRFIKDSKGGDMEEFPVDLRIREFPRS